MTEPEKPIVIQGEDLTRFLDDLHREAFGSERGEDLAQRKCAVCKQHPTFSTDAGRREYDISGVCEPCFDAMFEDDEDEEEEGSAEI